MKIKHIAAALLFALTGLGPAGGNADVPRQPEVVVLLHGLGRTDRSMRPLEKYLSRSGFEVANLRYASTEKAPDALVDDLRESVAACCPEAPTLHFVGHSLGGILIRAYLAEDAPNLVGRVGRVVMLAPPNHGSELVDSLGDSSLFRWALGPSALELGTDRNSLPNRLPPPSFEVGVIAGTGSVNPIGSALIPRDDDGTVSVSSARLDGMTDFLVVPSSHSFIMHSEKVAAQVVQFLRHGRFLHDESE